MIFEIRPLRAKKRPHVTRASARRIIEAVVFGMAEDPLVTRAHRRALLSWTLWKVTEAEYSKYRLPLRSYDALFDSERSTKPSRVLRHEHVWPRAALVDELLSGASIDRVLRRAVACVVTVDEAKRLNEVDGEGWERYRAARVRVVRIDEDGRCRRFDRKNP